MGTYSSTNSRTDIKMMANASKEANKDAKENAEETHTTEETHAKTDGFPPASGKTKARRTT